MIWLPYSPEAQLKPGHAACNAPPNWAVFLALKPGMRAEVSGENMALPQLDRRLVQING